MNYNTTTVSNGQAYSSTKYRTTSTIYKTIPNCYYQQTLSTLTPSQKYVFMYIYSKAVRFGYCNAAVKTIATHCRIARVTAQRALTVLFSHGLFDKTVKPYTSTRYSIPEYLNTEGFHLFVKYSLSKYKIILLQEENESLYNRGYIYNTGGDKKSVTGGMTEVQKGLLVSMVSTQFTEKGSSYGRRMADYRGTGQWAYGITDIFEGSSSRIGVISSFFSKKEKTELRNQEQVRCQKRLRNQEQRSQGTEVVNQGVVVKHETNELYEKIQTKLQLSRDDAQQLPYYDPVVLEMAYEVLSTKTSLLNPIAYFFGTCRQLRKKQEAGTLVVPSKNSLKRTELAASNPIHKRFVPKEKIHEDPLRAAANLQSKRDEMVKNLSFMGSLAANKWVDGLITSYLQQAETGIEPDRREFVASMVQTTDHEANRSTTSNVDTLPIVDDWRINEDDQWGIDEYE